MPLSPPPILNGPRFATLNVRGFNSRKKQYHLKRLLEDKDVDFLAVQETKLSTQEQVDRALEGFLNKYEVCVSHADGLSGGCLLFLKMSFQLTELMVTTDLCGRFIMCDFRASDIMWRVICVYAPNDVNQRVIFFSHLRPYLICDRVVVLLGDFNCVCDEADRGPTKSRIDKSARLLLDITEESNIFDAALFQQEQNPLPYTHFQGSSSARLDRIYCSVDLIHNLNGYTVDPVFFSDHCLVSLTFGMKQKKKSIDWKLWKLNCQILKDETFAISMTELLEKIGKTADHIFAKWELFKQELKQLAIERACILKFHKLEKEKSLLQDLRVLVESECKNPGQGLEDITRIKAELDAFYQERYQGAVVRARAERYFLGEQPTKRVMEEEKRYAISKDILEIEENNSIVTDRESIARVFVEHYQNIFGNSATSINNNQLKDLITLLPQLDQKGREAVKNRLTWQK